MMTIEKEVQVLVTFLSHPAGFNVDNVDWAGILTIRAISKDSPPSNWAVNWREISGEIAFDSEKCFTSL